MAVNMIDECLHMQQNVNENGYRMINPQDYRVNGCRQKMKLLAMDQYTAIYRGLQSRRSSSASLAVVAAPGNQCPAR